MAAWLFLASAALDAGWTVFTGGYMLTSASTPIGPNANAFSISYQPVHLLPEESRAAVTTSRTATSRYTAWLDRREVRAELAATTIVAAMPLMLLLFFVGRALWRISGPGVRHLDVALRDLRCATLAALLAAIAAGSADSLLAMIVFPGSPEGAQWYFAVDADLGLAVLLAIAAWIVTWAIAEGSRAARALDDFV